jgi:hypothetical protein
MDVAITPFISFSSRISFAIVKIYVIRTARVVKLLREYILVTSKGKDDDGEIGEKTHWTLPFNPMYLASLLDGVAHDKVRDDCKHKVPQG